MCCKSSVSVPVLRYGNVITAALESLVGDEALYAGLEDAEMMSLIEWAQGRIVWAASMCANEITARAEVEKETERARIVFKAVGRAMRDVTVCDRALAVAIVLQVVSETWR